MPLPSLLNGAKQCHVMTKRTKLRCKNLAAYGCRSCRMHGAHRSRNVLRDMDHHNYVNGQESKKSKTERSEKSAVLLYLRDLGDSVEMFNGVHTRGRKPKGYTKLNMKDPQQLAIALLRSIGIKQTHLSMPNYCPKKSKKSIN